MASNRVTKDISVFDCDSHIVEPPAVWDEYVPQKQRAWIKTQFCFHTDTDLLHINGRAVPAARERSNAAEVGWPRWNKKEVGKLTPGTPEWQRKFGRLLGCRDPHARLKDMDAIGTDQVMLFPTWFVRLALLRDPGARLQRLGLRLLRRRPRATLSLRGAADPERRDLDRGAAPGGEAGLPR